jgi:hypothetical protein
MQVRIQAVFISAILSSIVLGNSFDRSRNVAIQPINHAQNGQAPQAEGNVIPIVEAKDLGKALFAILPDQIDEANPIETSFTLIRKGNQDGIGPVDISKLRAMTLRRALKYIVDYIDSFSKACLSDEKTRPQHENTALVLSFLKLTIADLERGIQNQNGKHKLTVQAGTLGQAIFGLEDFLKSKNEKFLDSQTLFAEDDSKLSKALKVISKILREPEASEVNYDIIPGGRFLKRAKEALQKPDAAPCHLKGNVDSAPPSFDTKDLQVYTKDADGKKELLKEEGGKRVTEPGKKVFFSFPVKDDKSGVENIWFNLRESGGDVSTSGAIGPDGRVEHAIVVPQFVKPTEYQLNSVTARDKAGNESRSNFEKPLSLFEVKVKDPDTKSPEMDLNAIEVYTKDEKGNKIPVRKVGGKRTVESGTNVYFSFPVKDDKSGVEYVWFNLHEHGRNISASGTIGADGRVEYAIDVPKFVKPTDYQLNSVTVRDHAGNEVHKDMADAPLSLFETKDKDPDVRPPEMNLRDLQVYTKDQAGQKIPLKTENNVPVANPGSKIYFSFPVKDDKSGVEYVWFNLHEHGGNVSASGTIGADGRAEYNVDVPLLVKPVDYQFNSVTVRDKAGNEVSTNFDDKPLTLFKINVPSNIPATAIPIQPTSPPVQASSPVAVQRKIDAIIRGNIENLGSNSYKEREAATSALIEIGDMAVPALNNAVKSSDAEVRARAQFILNNLQDIKFP